MMRSKATRFILGAMLLSVLAMVGATLSMFVGASPGLNMIALPGVVVVAWFAHSGSHLSEWNGELIVMGVNICVVVPFLIGIWLFSIPLEFKDKTGLGK